MSLKAEIEAWVAALDAYESQDFDKALLVFDTIADSSKIWFNVGLIHATLGEHEAAVRAYREAMSRDEYFAVAAFQCGVSHFLLGRYQAAHDDFESAFGHMRGNFTIDYAQIGLKFRLYSCEILFNRGLSKLMLGRKETGMADLRQASGDKQTPEHSVIDEALDHRGQGYTVFSIPVGVLFRPSETKVKNLQARDYLGKARLVAAVEAHDTFTGFIGAERQALERKKQQEREEQPSFKAPTMQRSATDPIVPTYKAASITSPMMQRRPTQATISVNTAPFPAAARSSISSPLTKASITSPVSKGAVTSPVSRGSPPISSAVVRNKTLASRTRTGSMPTNAVKPGRLTPPPQPTSEPPTPIVVPHRRTSSDSGASSAYSSPRSSSLLYRAVTMLQRPQPSSSSGHHRSDSNALPAIPQERDSDSVGSLLDAYDEEGQGGEAVLWQGDKAHHRSPREPRSPTDIRKWVEKSGKWSLGRSPSGRKKKSSHQQQSSPSQPTVAESRSRGHARTPWKQPASSSREARWEDKGYVSDEERLRGLERIRIKLHYSGDVRGLVIDADLPFDEVMERIRSKFSIKRPKLRFKDEEGAIISLVDESDWECAVEMARDIGRGRAEAKLDIYVD